MNISTSLAKNFSNYGSQQSGGSKLRAKRIAPLLNMIENVFAEKGAVNIIDIGGTEQYWGIVPAQFLKDHNASITIVNLPGSKLPDDHGPFHFVHADACNLETFTDNAFDIAHSNSVVEHVGDWRRMQQFARELSRVANRYFVQTPNFWFPIEPHFMAPFFHWLPEPIRIWLATRFRLGSWKRAESVNEAVLQVQSARLLNKKMFQALLPDGHLETERVLLLPKSFIAIRK